MAAFGYGCLQPSRAPGSQGKVTLGWEEVLLLGRMWEGPWVRKEQVSALLFLLILKYDRQLFLGLRNSLEREEGKEESFSVHVDLSLALPIANVNPKRHGQFTGSLSYLA